MAPLKSEPQEDLRNIYAARFSGVEQYRLEVWKILILQFFSRWVHPDHAVLDLGCGYGEFINTVQASRKFAMDLNPSVKGRLAPDIQLIEQDCSQPWPLEGGSLDVVFTSNFFEHLPNKQALQATLGQAFRCLKTGGVLIALGPNIKFLPGEYWDFLDHYLPLTELSLSEGMTLAGYKIERVIRKFLPYTMSQGSRPPLWTVSLFLKLPLLWEIFGRQFLVVGRKPG